MRSRRAAFALLCALVLPVLAACSAQSTPLCDQAARLADGHHLGAALSRYMDADRAGEGGCAEDGKKDVQELQSKVALVIAQGTSAEARGEVKAAEDLYVQALTQDVDNPQVRAALGRVQASQAGTPGTPAPTATLRPSASESSGSDPVVVILVTVVLLVALATGIIASLAGDRDRPARTAAALPWGRGGDEASRRVEELEAQVAFLLEAVERLAGASPVPRVRTEYVAPRSGPPKSDRTTTVSGVTVVRLQDDDAPGRLLVVCRRLVHEAERPEDELLADIARLGTPDAPHLEILLEEAAIAAATKGLLDSTWRVVQEAWQVEAGAHGLVARQVRELVDGRPVVLPPAATALPEPLGRLARQVAGQVQSPGAELPGPSRVLLHATGIAARPAQEASVLLTGAVRWLMYDLTADAVVRGVRDALQPPDPPPSDAGRTPPSLPSGSRPPTGEPASSPPPSSPPQSSPPQSSPPDTGPAAGNAAPDSRGDRPDAGSGHEEGQVTTVLSRPAEDPAGYGLAHLLEHPRRPGAPPAGG